MLTLRRYYKKSAVPYKTKWSNNYLDTQQVNSNSDSDSLFVVEI